MRVETGSRVDSGDPNNLKGELIMPVVRKFVLMFDHDGPGEVFVLYGTADAVQQRVQVAIARAERYPNEETPPEPMREIAVILTEELAQLLDEAWKKQRTDTEQNLFDVFTAFAQGVDAVAPEIEKRREANRQFSKMLLERIQKVNTRNF